MSSSMGYPNPTSSHQGHAGTTAITGITSTAMTAVLSTATFPWHVFLRWLSWCCGLAVRSTTSLGAPPPRGYLPAEKLKELTSIVNHMHTREDLYRRAIRELQEELDAKDTDRKKALKKLKATKTEIESLTERLMQSQAAYQATTATAAAHADSEDVYGSSGDHHTYDYQYNNNASNNINSFGVHVTVLAAAGAVWFFSQTDHAALHWKLVFSIFFPLLWAYVSWMAARESSGASGRAKKKETPLLILCAAWFLIGFAVALSLGQL